MLYFAGTHHGCLQSALVFLDISDNNLTNFAESREGIRAITDLIAFHPALTSINLSHNRIDTRSIGSIASALEDSPSLIELCLDANDIQPRVPPRL